MRLTLRAVLVIGLVSALSVPGRALPIMSDALAASLAVVDREAVRNPYITFAGILNQSSVNAIPIGRSVVASGSAIGSFGSTFGGGGFVPRTLPVVISAPPPSGGVYFSFSDARPQSNVIIGAVQVPEGGATLILFGTSVLALVLLRRKRRASRLATS